MSRLTILALVVTLLSGCATLRKGPEGAKADVPSESSQRIGTALKCGFGGGWVGAAGGLFVGARTGVAAFPPAAVVSIAGGAAGGAIAGWVDAIKALAGESKTCWWQR